MILGVYWYFKFPENVYHFQFFKFLKGFGGHADNLAELEARVSVEHPENLLKKLEELHARFKNTYIDIQINADKFMISTGDYHLFDCHFQLAEAIEQLLISENAVLFDSPFEIKSRRSFSPEKGEFETIEHRFIQIIGSDFKKDNAENLSIRIDCNLPIIHKKDLINDLTRICIEENIHVFYYNNRDYKDHCNLMLFFTNGRQFGNATQKVQINSFGSKIRHLTQKYPLQFGHFGGMEHYPLHGPFVQLIKDEEYILNKK
ncbi:hypothetical protein CLU96_4005 [Chryseobacterium sp. 52]|uniref:hypothetical protein n=1 Tax=Chryseobacterium sp. 52 TaxID=2035213 RepID=UPI000C18C5D2|nr:hypothetical protein [Chryseobacterium sp. 52]PIF46959.1 hypothetical protein CLU96_4005 [Chryseobacterium sp. 52]